MVSSPRRQSLLAANGSVSALRKRGARADITGTL
jgi:hypothetical protein